jgi:hypothetical protein
MRTYVRVARDSLRSLPGRTRNSRSEERATRAPTCRTCSLPTRSKSSSYSPATATHASSERRRAGLPAARRMPSRPPRGALRDRPRRAPAELPRGASPFDAAPPSARGASGVLPATSAPSDRQLTRLLGLAPDRVATSTALGAPLRARRRRRRQGRPTRHRCGRPDPAAVDERRMDPRAGDRSDGARSGPVGTQHTGQRSRPHGSSDAVNRRFTRSGPRDQAPGPGAARASVRARGRAAAGTAPRSRSSRGTPSGRPRATRP